MPDNNNWFLEAYAYLLSRWNEGAYGLTFGEIILATLAILIAILIRTPFSRVVVHSAAKLAHKTESKIDDAIVAGIATPLKMVPLILGVYVAAQIIDIQGQPSVILNRIVQSVITLAVFWSLARAVNAFETVLKERTDTLSRVIADWLIKVLQIILIVLGLGAVAQLWGIAVAPILAGLGVFGIAVGLGAQDLFKNLISGILILSEKRFLPGEWIKVDGVVEGTVEEINFRSTLVRQFDKAPVYIPNGLLSDSAVTNFSRMTHRRIKWIVGVEYRTTVDQLRFIRDKIEKTLLTDERFSRPPETSLFVRINSFSPSSIDFLIYCFTKTTNWGEWLEIKEEFAVTIKDIVEEAGTSFAFPSQTVYLQQLDPPEILTPPKDKTSNTKKAIKET